jgi:predicted transcriptional regulator
MVREAVIHKVANLIYTTYKNRCVTISQVADFIKKSENSASYSLVKLALDILMKDGKVKKVKLYKSYAIYCIGKEPKLNEAVDHNKVEECINKYMPSFMLMQVAECVLGHRPVGSPSVIYSAILYVLMRMVREKKIRSFTVVGGTRNRLKAIIQK